MRYFLTTILFSFIYCSTFSQEIGTEFQGGILISKDNENKLGLVVAKNDIGKWTWERSKLECMKYDAGGYKDWKLPEIGLFGPVYEYFKKIYYWKDDNLGMSPGYYWSATPYQNDPSESNEFRYVFRFSDKDLNWAKMDLELYVRPVRIVKL